MPFWFSTPIKSRPPCCMSDRGLRHVVISPTLAMAFDDPLVDDDLREAMAAHEIVLGQKWADVE